MNHPNKEIMSKAIKIAKDNVDNGKHAVAAIIVKDDKIISEAYTTIQRDNDPTKHAEINAIREAAKKLNSYKLEECWLYTTFEPCPMCTSACVWARMKGIVYGASMDDRNEKYAQRILIRTEEVLKHGTPKLKLHKDFMREECKKLLLL
ncbi:nucleoside deaminase [Candidatus Woesearchaeota archaeon]|nr:nucleoside deaminase [Candidatus Woesearchaeota archaeon]